MEKLTAIRESLNSLSATDLTKLEPDRLAKGLTHMQGLHRELAVVLSEDAKSSWDVDTLHQEINAMEQAWKLAANAPKLEAQKLTEAQGRVIKALHATATLAMKYRDRLGESIKENITAKADRKTAVERGKGWMEKAKTAEESLETVSKRLALCYEGLDEFTRRYNEDVTALGTRLLQLEFADKITADEKIAKALKEAKKPAELVIIREQLEGKLDAEGKPIAAPAVVVPAAVAPVAAVAATEVVNPAIGESTVTIAPPVGSVNAPTAAKMTNFKRPFSISESLDSTRRLSEAHKADLELKTA